MSDEPQVLTAERPSETRPLRFAPVMRSPLTEQHRRLGAQLAVQDGWELPLSYGAVERERQAIRDGLEPGAPPPDARRPAGTAQPQLGTGADARGAARVFAAADGAVG